MYVLLTYDSVSYVGNFTFSCRHFFLFFFFGVYSVYTFWQGYKERVDISITIRDSQTPSVTEIILTLGNKRLIYKFYRLSCPSHTNIVSDTTPPKSFTFFLTSWMKPGGFRLFSWQLRTLLRLALRQHCYHTWRQVRRTLYRTSLFSNLFAVLLKRKDLYLCSLLLYKYGNLKHVTTKLLEKEGRTWRSFTSVSSFGD